MHYVIEATYLSGYKLVVRFEDGHEKLVDLASHLDGPVFEPLKNPQFFRSFTVNPDIDTVTWPNNADFSPDFLYEIGLDLIEKSASRDGQ
jgi:hypothetical protein